MVVLGDLLNYFFHRNRVLEDVFRLETVSETNSDQELARSGKRERRVGGPAAKLGCTRLASHWL